MGLFWGFLAVYDLPKLLVEGDMDNSNMYRCCAIRWLVARDAVFVGDKTMCNTYRKIRTRKE